VDVAHPLNYDKSKQLSMESPNAPVTKADLQAALASAVDEIKSYVREQVFDAETKLLRAYSDHNTATTIRFRKLAADVSNTDTSGHNGFRMSSQS